MVTIQIPISIVTVHPSAENQKKEKEIKKKKKSGPHEDLCGELVRFSHCGALAGRFPRI